jgi:protein tyrosine phosphatase (PTP) superfamily phosphohydrolase (DUF442 family)
MADSDLLRALLSTIPYAALPVDGVLTAGQPGPAAWQALAAAGVRTVVDLRAPEEPRGHDEPKAVRAAGLRYVLLPVVQPLLSDAHFDRIRELMRAESGGGVMVHCATSNRVGGMLLPYFMLDLGMRVEEAVAAAQRAGLRSPELATIALDYARRIAAAR